MPSLHHRKNHLNTIAAVRLVVDNHDDEGGMDDLMAGWMDGWMDGIWLTAARARDLLHTVQHHCSRRHSASQLGNSLVQQAAEGVQQPALLGRPRAQ